MKREYHYKDILLIPKFSNCESRSDVDLSTKLGKFTFKSPIIPANMKTIINENLAARLANWGYFYIMHRFGDEETWQKDTKDFIARIHEGVRPSSISVGIKERDHRLLEELTKEPPDFITVDIAHGHSVNMKPMVETIKSILPNTFLIAGNVCTADAALWLEDLGVDAVKVGIGPGYVCTTKLMTGFSRPQFSAVEACSKVIRVPVIADGGIEYNGDIAKALVAGATMVMCGFMLAGFDESPGEKTIDDEGRITKVYYGSASKNNKAISKHIEGRRINVPYRGSIWDKYREIEESLQSSCSYAGVSKSSDLRNAVDWVVQN